MSQNTLLMPFIDESEMFTLGFECGQVWVKIEEGESLNSYLIHVKNIEQVKLICRTFGIECGIDIVDDTWAYLTTKSILNV